MGWTTEVLLCGVSKVERPPNDDGIPLIAVSCSPFFEWRECKTLSPSTRPQGINHDVSRLHNLLTRRTYSVTTAESHTAVSIRNVLTLVHHMSLSTAVGQHIESYKRWIP